MIISTHSLFNTSTLQSFNQPFNKAQSNQTNKMLFNTVILTATALFSAAMASPVAEGGAQLEARQRAGQQCVLYW